MLAAGDIAVDTDKDGVIDALDPDSDNGMGRDALFPAMFS
jgi:hypothetical protein